MRKIISNEPEANRISNGHHQKITALTDLLKAAVTITPVKPALSVPAAATTDQVAEVALRTWIARLRTVRVAIFLISASKTSNVRAEAADSAAIVLVVAAVIDLAAEDSAAVIDLVEVAALAEADLVDLGAVAGVDGEFRSWIWF